MKTIAAINDSTTTTGCDCNYADNYYGDQACRPTGAQPQSSPAGQ